MCNEIIFNKLAQKFEMYLIIMSLELISVNLMYIQQNFLTFHHNEDKWNSKKLNVSIFYNHFTYSYANMFYNDL